MRGLLWQLGVRAAQTVAHQQPAQGGSSIRDWCQKAEELSGYLTAIAGFLPFAEILGHQVQEIKSLTVWGHLWARSGWGFLCKRRSPVPFSSLRVATLAQGIASRSCTLRCFRRRLDPR